MLKRTAWIVSVPLLIYFLIFFVSQTHAANLLVNPGFESGTTTNADNWAETSADRTATNCHSGSWCIELKDTTQVTWTSLTNTTATPNSNDLKKTAGTDSVWNADAISNEQIASFVTGVGVSGKLAQTNKFTMFGLSADDPDANFTGIDFGLDFTNTGTVAMYENGTVKTSTYGCGGSPTYTTSDVWSIRLNSYGFVEYVKNNVLVCTSTATVTYPLWVDTSIHGLNASILDIKLWTSTIDTGGNVISDAITVASNTRIHISGWVRAATSGAYYSLSSTIKLIDSTSSSDVTGCVKSLHPGATYQYVSIFCNTGSSTGVKVKLMSGNAWWDDIVVETDYYSLGNATWWDNRWTYRNKVYLDNAGGGTGTEIPIRFTQPWRTGMSADFSDIIVTYWSGSAYTVIPFYIDYKVNSSSAVIWARVPTLTSASTNDLYVYWGNANYGIYKKYSGNPILSPSAGDDSSWAVFGNVVKVSETDWRMYYQGYDGTTHRMRYATSTDGISWTKQGRLTNLSGVGQVPVVYKNSSSDYEMIYFSSATAMNRAYSTTGDLTWTNDTTNNPVMVPADASWTPGTVEPCFGMGDVSGTKYLWWNQDTPHPRGMSRATSSDFINWSDANTSPIFASGTATWRWSSFCGNMVVYGGNYYLYMIGFSDANSASNYQLDQIGLYYCGTDPTCAAGNRTFRGIVSNRGGHPAWEGDRIDTTNAVITGANMYFYYTGFGTSAGVGLMTAQPVDIALLGPIQDDQEWTFYTMDERYINAEDWEYLSTTSYLGNRAWATSGTLSIDTTNFRSGAKSLKCDATSAVCSAYRSLNVLTKGVSSSWIMAGQTNRKDTIVLVDNVTSKLGIGFNTDGKFQYWDGTGYISTGVSYSANTWYLVEQYFDTVIDEVNYFIYDASYTLLWSAYNITVAAASSISRNYSMNGDLASGALYWSDDARISSWHGAVVTYDVSLATSSFNITPNKRLNPTINKSLNSLTEAVH